MNGQGNFGSEDNDPPAAMPANIDQETVDSAENFDGSLQEPTVLPARLPNPLVNGASGIAAGMATNIPPRNPSDVCDALIHLTDKPDANVSDLMTFVKGPDFPAGGVIAGGKGIREAYETERGQTIVRAKASSRCGAPVRMRTVVDEPPYQVNKAAMVEKVAALVKERKPEGISDMRDEDAVAYVTVVFGADNDPPIMGVTALGFLGYKVDPVAGRLNRVEMLML